MALAEFGFSCSFLWCGLYDIERDINFILQIAGIKEGDQVCLSVLLVSSAQDVGRVLCCVVTTCRVYIPTYYTNRVRMFT